MVKYLDSKGLGILWDKTKSYAQSQAKAITDTKGAANGLATLDENGKIPVAQLGNLDTELFKVVTELPKTDILTDKIYIVKDSTNENDLYQEYYYTNGAWEELGTHAVKVDLEPYAKTSEVDTKLSSKADKTELSKYLPLTGGTLTGSIKLGSRQGVSIGDDTNEVNATLASTGLSLIKTALDDAETDYLIDGIDVNLDGNSYKKLLFPNKGGTFALTSDIPDITGKVDKVEGKGLSTNDYTTAEKTKLAGIPADANHIDVDSALSDSSENPVQNKVVKTAIDDCVKIGASIQIGNVDIDNGLVNVGNSQFNSDSLIINQLNGGVTSTYKWNCIEYDNRTGNYSLKFPNKEGTFALTSDIPDVSGKADTATVNAELAKKLNTSDITAISEDELTALLV